MTRKQATCKRLESNLEPLYSSEWYTPSAIIERVKATFETIDCDPCSNSKECPNVPATVIYTQEDDGLSKEWRGRVYMNPPYGREVSDWVDKLLEEVESNRVTEAIVLVAARVDTRWFRRLSAKAQMWCAVSGRLRFSDSKNSAPFPSAILFITNTQGREQDFYRHFADTGTIYRQIVDEECT